MKRNENVKFWREKNADKFTNVYKVEVPDNKTLKDELIKKFYEKLNMINVIFDKNKRDEYLRKKNKLINHSLPESLIQQKIGSRVIIDFIQLIFDYCSNEKISYEFSCTPLKTANNPIKIQDNILKWLNLLQKNKNYVLKNIYRNVISLMDYLKLNIYEIENERKIIEEKEGCFLKGKLVYMENN